MLDWRAIGLHGNTAALYPDEILGGTRPATVGDVTGDDTGMRASSFRGATRWRAGFNVRKGR